MTHFILWLEGWSHRHAGAPTPPPHTHTAFRTPSHWPPQDPQEKSRTGQGPPSVPCWTMEVQCVRDLPMITQEPQWGSQGSVAMFTQCLQGLMCKRSLLPCSVLTTPSLGRGEPGHLEPPGTSQAHPKLWAAGRIPESFPLGREEPGGAQSRPHHPLPRVQGPMTQQPLTKGQSL